ncbi:MAG: DUF2182 domain-containing protein, partial [Cytophagaceae bacterium]|nr:DUF2182 domain-containing protein [Gemmatimonadaceae bacterium]
MEAEAHGAPGDANRAVDASPGNALVERIVRRDRIVVGAGVVVLASLAWAHLLGMGRHDSAMGRGMGAGMVMPHMQEWGGANLVLLIGMWAVMMVAMMLPAAAPMIVLFQGTVARRKAAGRAFVPT